MASSEQYDATTIKVLGGIEAVRKRPAMYIGDVSERGLHHLVEEVVDNSIDEAMADFCQNITVKVNSDNSVTVNDDGRGIPVDVHRQTKRPALEVVMTTLHAGGKFDHKSYKVSGGLHGVGISVVNALSEWLEVESRRDGHVYHMAFARGKISSRMEKRGASTKTGTKITFKPDEKIFEATVVSFDILANRMRELAFLNRGVCIKVNDERDGREETFEYEGGIVTFVKHLNDGKDVVHSDIIYFEKQEDDISVELAMQYHTAYSENIFSFVNNINTIEGGTHLSGFKSSLTRTFNAYLKKHGSGKNDIMPGGEDIREGLTAVISVRVPDPQFESQTKIKLGNREVQGVVESIINDQLSSYLEEHPQTSKRVAQKAAMAAQAREAARKARDLTRRKGALSSGNLPPKLADCSSKEISHTEIYIVEGQSAGGNAKQCRDSLFQAILPIQGKILNVEKARIDKMLGHEEIKMIISALGTGVGSDEFDIAKIRYGRVIIMTDADVDGLHIRTLLLTFFFRQMPELIDKGFIHIAQPPLFRAVRKRKEQYYQDEQDMKEALVGLGLDGTTLSHLESDVQLSSAKLKDVAKLLVAMEGHARVTARRGMSLRELLALRRPEQGGLPLYKVTRNGEDRFLYSEEELNSYIREQEARVGTELEIVEDDESEPSTDKPKLYVSELLESREIEKTVKEIEARTLEIGTYFAEEEDETQPEPQYKYKLVSDNEESGIRALEEIPATLRAIGQKGMEIQRYKGLGEMNPSQLWETTMDPKTRTLVRVKLEDTVKADKIFSLLMGEKVAPRREFIETYAREAKNLDI